MSTEPNHITHLLHHWQGGRQEALDQLMPLVYDQLRVLASYHINKEDPGHTLRATELVHEAYLQLVGSNAPIQDQAHFYTLASRIIRHILVDHGRAKRSQKRGGGALRVPLDQEMDPGVEPAEQFSEIDQALERLHSLDPRKARLVELTFFAGMAQDKAAEAVGISTATVRRELRLAKAWLYRELHQNQPRRS